MFSKKRPHRDQVDTERLKSRLMPRPGFDDIDMQWLWRGRVEERRNQRRKDATDARFGRVNPSCEPA